MPGAVTSCAVSHSWRRSGKKGKDMEGERTKWLFPRMRKSIDSNVDAFDSKLVCNRTKKRKKHHFLWTVFQSKSKVLQILY